MSLKNVREHFKGFVIHTRQIGEKEIEGIVIEHVAFKPACNSCNPLLEYFDITEFKIK